MQPSPGSFVSLYGLNFTADQLVTAENFPLPPKLAGVSVLVNGTAVPVEAVTPWQINAQLPQNTPVGNATFQVVANGVAANTVTAQIRSSAPVVFAFVVTNPQTGSYWQAAAFHAGTAVLADTAHPAAGETLETYGSGIGLTTPPVAAGEPSPGSPPAAALVIPPAQIGLQPARVTFAGLVPGLAGVYQINVVVPDGLTAGEQPFSWTGDNRGTAIFVQ